LTSSSVTTPSPDARPPFSPQLGSLQETVPGGLQSVALLRASLRDDDGEKENDKRELRRLQTFCTARATGWRKKCSPMSRFMTIDVHFI
jgi:hypothetical protein